MQMSVVMSMRLILGDDWNDVPCSHHAFDLWQWCNFSRIEALEFGVITHAYSLRPADVFEVVAKMKRVLNQFRRQIVEYDIKSEYPEESSTVNKLVREKPLASKSCFV